MDIESIAHLAVSEYLYFLIESRESSGYA